MTDPTACGRASCSPKTNSQHKLLLTTRAVGGGGAHCSVRTLAADGHLVGLDGGGRDEVVELASGGEAWEQHVARVLWSVAWSGPEVGVLGATWKVARAAFRADPVEKGELEDGDALADSVGVCTDNATDRRGELEAA